MSRNSINYYLIKIARTSGWLLLGLLLVYIVTGFSLCGKLGVSNVLDLQTALAIHKIFDWPLVAVVLVHSSITVYFALRRWGWIKKRHRRRPASAPAVTPGDNG
jgi:succinate dehydrogenase/fumarate reductase cytochrome b subunit